MNIVVISEVFSLYPMGRNDADGPNNGQKFFKEFIKPSIETKEPTTVVFDGIHSCGSSFLDEAFYEMPKKLGVGGREFNQLISIQASGQAYRFYKKMAEDFMAKIPK